MMDRLNQTLPEGLAVTRWELSPSKKEVAACSSIRYQIQLKTGEFDKSRLEAFLASDAFVITRVNRKGTMSLVNYKEHVEHLELDGGNRLILTIRSGQQQTLRPSELLAAVFELSDEAIKTARIVKLAPA
jgi:radical SAM-linked protein